MSEPVWRRVIPTPHGDARASAWLAPEPRGTLILGHGAGGTDWSADLVALTSLATERDGWAVVLVEQPWRVAGRRVAAPPRQLDVAWGAVLAELAATPLPRPWITGGRSAGARVACRTASAVAADAVLALAFPLHPPGRPDSSRASELAAVPVPVEVVQGERDPFGSPAEVRAACPGVPVGAVPGAHAFGTDPQPVVVAVRAALARLVQATPNAGSR